MVSLVPLPEFAGHLGSSDVSAVFVPKIARRHRVVVKAALHRFTQLQNTA